MRVALKDRADLLKTFLGISRGAYVGHASAWYEDVTGFQLIWRS